MVAGITRALLEMGANLEDASMTRLGGEFTMMLVCALPATATEPRLKKNLAPLRKKGLTIDLKSIPAALALGQKRQAPDALISVYGTDRPGIVYEVTHLLARRKVNITDLNTKVVQQPGAGDVYIMLLEVRLPPALTMDALSADLQALQKSLGVDISCHRLDPVEL